MRRRVVRELRNGAIARPGLRGREPPVDVERLSGHVARLGRGEEDVRGGELRRLAGPPHGYGAAEVRELLLRLAARRLQDGPGGAGRDGVHADAARSELERERLGEGVD